MMFNKGIQKTRARSISSIHVRDYQAETPTMGEKHTPHVILSSLLVHRVSKLQTKDPISPLRLYLATHKSTPIHLVWEVQPNKPLGKRRESLVQNVGASLSISEVWCAFEYALHSRHGIV
jgi:hypothetical protein